MTIPLLLIKGKTSFGFDDFHLTTDDGTEIDKEVFESGILDSNLPLLVRRTGDDSEPDQ